MQLKKMRKVIVRADISQKEQLLDALYQVGIRHFHVMECLSPLHGSDSTNHDGEARQIQLELLVDSSMADAVLKSLTDEGGRSVPRDVTILEVLANSESSEDGGQKSSQPHEEKWGDFLITV
jgi:hypothetical protein